MMNSMYAACQGLVTLLGIFISKEDIDTYSFLYLQFVFSYCLDVVLAYDVLIFHVCNGYAYGFSSSMVLCLLTREEGLQSQGA